MQIKDNNKNEDKIPEDEILTWEIEEYTYYERSKKWYAIAITTAFLMLLFSFWGANFLFSMVVIIIALIVILHDGRRPDLVPVIISDEGIQVGRKIYLYDELQNFSILYKPKSDIKNLYFEFKNSIRQRISVPLKNTDPLQIREYLLRYLPEDLDRTTLPLSETLARILKL